MGEKKHSQNTFTHVKEATGKKKNKKKNTELIFPLVLKMRPDFAHCRHLTYDEQTSGISV